MRLAVIDGGDQSASHVLVLDAGVPVATARLTIMSEGQGRIARITLLPAYRGTGLGRHWPLPDQNEEGGVALTQLGRPTAQSNRTGGGEQWRSTLKTRHC